MNEKTPPPKLENIKAAIKFTTTPPNESGYSQLVASLHVGSATWFSDAEAKRHPELLAIVKEKLARHLLRQLFHDQRAEMSKATDDFMKGWSPGRLTVDGVGAFDIRDRLCALSKYTPPPGFDDDEFDCDRGENCGCEQFEFLLPYRRS